MKIDTFRHENNKKIFSEMKKEGDVAIFAAALSFGPPSDPVPLQHKNALCGGGFPTAQGV